MPKRVRFLNLVKKSGRPETLTLWTKPKANPALMKAMNENRMLTIHQAKGAKKDIGRIGFHQEPAAIYLVFPKKLPKPADISEVTGIHYDLLKQAGKSAPSLQKEIVRRTARAIKPARPEKQPVSRASPLQPKPAPNPASAPNPPHPARKAFKISVLRTATDHMDLTVQAESMREAEQKALATVKQKKFKASKVQNEVKAIAMIGDSVSGDS